MSLSCVSLRSCDTASKKNQFLLHNIREQYFSVILNRWQLKTTPPFCMHNAGCLEKELQGSGVGQSWNKHEDGLFKIVPHCFLQH
jgi:hypothetical protein